MISASGASFEDALFKANDLMLANQWGDGLPLWPPTRERVEWILRGASLPRAHALGTFPPRGGVASRGDLRDRAGDGGRAPRVSARARGGRRGVPRSGLRQRAAPGGVGQRVSRGDRQRADRREDPPQLRLRLSRPRPAAARRRQHRARAPAHAAERGRRAAGRGHDGQLRRPALHQRRVRRGRGEPARRLAGPRRRSPRLRARARARSRSPSPTAPPISGGEARRRRPRKRTRSRACTAWPISCACPTWPASPATSAARRAS